MSNETTEVTHFRGFGDFVRERMSEWKAAGIAVGIVRSGRLVFSEGFGLRDVSKALPVTPETVFAIGSCTKGFTAACVAMAVDDGLLEWDRPVRDYVPTFRMFDPVATDRLTLRDMLAHRSGLPRHEAVWLGSKATREELFERLRYLEPAWDFRQRYHYQNLMYMAAGYVLEKVTGSTWEAYAQERIFRPLGMAHTSLSVRDIGSQDDYCLPYTQKDGKVIQIPFRNIDAVGPAGSINSNLLDMAQWLHLNLGQGEFGGKRLVSQKSLAECHHPQSVFVQERGSLSLSRNGELGDMMYCMGWAQLPYRGHRVIYHVGGIDGFISVVGFLPDDDAGILILCNTSPSPLPTLVSYSALDRVLGLPPIDWSDRIRQSQEAARKAAEQSRKKAVSARVAGTSPSHPIDAYVGDYWHPGYGLISVSVKDGALRATRGVMTFDLSHFHYDVFALAGDGMPMTLLATFIADPSGAITRMEVPLEPNLKPITFVRNSA